MLNVYPMILSLLDRREKKRLLLLLCLVIVTGLLEMVGVASILPLLQVIADPGMVETNRFLAGLYGWFGFESIRSFQIFLGAAAFCVVIFGLGFRALTTYALNRFTVMRSYRFSLRLLQGYLHQPYVWFLNRHSSLLRNAVLSEVEKMVSGVMMPAMLLLPAMLSAGLIITLIFVLEPLVAIGAVLVLGGAYGLIFLLLRNILAQLGERRLAASRARARVVQEATGGLKELKLMGLEGGFTTRFEKEARKLARINSVTVVMKQMPRFALEGLAFGGMILMILFLLLRGGGEITEVLPTLGVVAIAALRLFPALQGIYSNIATIRFNKATMESVHADLVALDPQSLRDRVAADKLSQIRLQQGLELRDVSYAYPDTDRSALDRLSLTIPANTTVGIVGSTGAGKTTVVDLILGLLRPQSGALIVDGQEITDDLLRAWQKSVGYVPQQIYLTASSLAMNIAFGVPEKEIDMAAVERAARVAALHDFVQEQLPQGYHTIIGEQGVRLSGGQRQRVGIARALYRDPEILIMDEATSALDNLTEQAVMEAVYNLAGAKTVVMIAHRLTTVAPCDTIFLMERGRLVTQGSYDELVAGNSYFRRMATGS